jgi:hypothetical protein
MYKASRLLKLASVGLFLLSACLVPSPAWAVPASFQWGSFDSLGSTAYGVYEHDNVTILQTGDLAQLIWAGPNGVIDPPTPSGGVTGDDVILDTSAVNNGAPLPPPARNRGYIPIKTYSFDTGNPQNNGTIYIRAWNASTAAGATAYGDSTTGTLTNGGTFNAPRWIMMYTPNAVTLSSFRAAGRPGNALIWGGLGLLAVVAAAAGLRRWWLARG